MSDAETIKQLNDEFRQTMKGGRVMMTAGVSNCPDIISIIRRVRSFNAFDAADDPYGEHDFGAFDHEGEKIYWKIDYYDLALNAHSPDPADPAVTSRVLTIMLASEY